VTLTQSAELLHEGGFVGQGNGLRRFLRDRQTADALGLLPF
jgi:hypothetical protein